MKILKMNRRLVSLLLVLTMVVSLFSGLTISASATDESSTNDDPIYHFTLSSIASDYYIKSGSDVAEIVDQGAGYVNVRFLKEGTAAIGCKLTFDDSTTSPYYFEVVNAGTMMVGDTKTVQIATPKTYSDGSRIQYLKDNEYVAIDKIDEGETTSVTFHALKGGAMSTMYTRYEYFDDGHFVSEDIVGYLAINAKRYDPTAEMFTVSDNTYTYDGTAKSVTAAVKAEYAENMGEVTAKYYAADGSEVTNPTEPGTYTVKLSVAESDYYNAAELTDDSWTLTIAEAAHTVTVADCTNGTVTADQASATAGTAVNLTVAPDEGYELSSLTVTDDSGNAVAVSDNQFTMPAANVTVAAEFAAKHTHDDITFDKLDSSFTGGALTSGSYVLTGDITLTQPITIASGETVNLCLNGYVINANYSCRAIQNAGTLNIYDCNSTEQTHYFSVSSNYWTLTSASDSAVNYADLTYRPSSGVVAVTGGAITGGSAGNGAAVYEYSTAALTMTDVNVIGNYCSDRGIIWFDNATQVTVNNCTISGNYAVNHGTVYSTSHASTFIMNGGHIQFNKVTKCGSAIRVDGYNYLNDADISFNLNLNTGAANDLTAVSCMNSGNKITISGNTVIENNYRNDSSRQANLLLCAVGQVIVKDPGENMKVGISANQTLPVAVTGTNAADYSQYFTSDNGYTVGILNPADEIVYLSSGHVHHWTYTADGAVITAACNSTLGTCTGASDTTLTLNAPASLSYDGTEKAATFAETSLAGQSTLPAITYYSGDTQLEGAPTEVGTYTAQATVGDATASVTYTIDYEVIHHEAVPAVEGTDGTIEYWEKNGVMYSDAACTTQITDVTAHYVSDASFHWTWYKETATGNVWSAYYTATCANCGESILTDEYQAPIVTTTEDNARITHTATITVDGVTYTSVKTEEKNYTITLNGEAKEGYSYGQYVTLVGPDANTKYDWTMDGKVVLTNSRTYSFYVTDNTVITTSTASESKASVSFTATDRVTYDTTKGYTRVKYTLRWTLPDGCTLVGAGLKRAYGSAYDTVLTADQLTTNNKTSLRTQNGTYTYTLNMSAATSQKSVNAMGYVTYKDASGATQTVYSDIITTNGNHTHSYDCVVTREATCTVDGLKTYTCSVCGDTYTETIPATGTHTYGEGVVTKAATCVADGEKTYTCTVCGASYTETIPATGVHTWDNGVVTKEATTTDNGIMTYTCTACGATYTEAIVMDTVTYTYEGTDEFGGIDGAEAAYPICRIGETGKYYVLLAEDAETGVKVTMDQDGVVTVSGNGSMDSFVNEDDYSTPWLAATDYVKAVVIEDGITTICNSAFQGCTNLTSVSIPGTVAYIEDYAFYGCTGLNSLTIPNGVTRLGRQIIMYSGVTDLTIPASVTKLNSKAFSDCNNLESVTIEGGLQSIAGDTFYYCSNLKTVTILGGVKTINAEAFRACVNLKTVILPTSLKTVEIYAFDYCNSITDVYYMGTESEWSGISIDSGNGTFTTATRHYEYNPNATAE